MLAGGRSFYLTVNNNMAVDLSNLKTWYKCGLLGKHSIDNLWRMYEASGIKGNKTNHSIQKNYLYEIISCSNM